MELLHCEKLRKQKTELEKAEMDLVSVSQIKHKKSQKTSECLFFTPFRVNMSFLQRSWAVNWLRLYTEMLQGKSKVGRRHYVFGLSVRTLHCVECDSSSNLEQIGTNGIKDELLRFS